MLYVSPYAEAPSDYADDMKVDRSAMIAALQLWTDQGWPRHRLEEKASDLWGLSHEELSQLLGEIRLRSKQAYAIDRPEFLAQQMTRIEALAARATEEGNLTVALACYRELHSLARLTGG